MPGAQAHVEQYQHNQQVLEAPLFNSAENGDWAATIIFYCAVHLVEKVLAEAANPYHSPDHERRRNAVTREAKLRRIAAEYQALYIQSIRARYECSRFTKKDIDDALDLLDPIKKIALAG